MALEGVFRAGHEVDGFANKLFHTDAVTGAGEERCSLERLK